MPFWILLVHGFAWYRVHLNFFNIWKRLRRTPPAVIVGACSIYSIVSEVWLICRRCDSVELSLSCLSPYWLKGWNVQNVWRIIENNLQTRTAKLPWRQALLFEFATLESVPILSGVMAHTVLPSKELTQLQWAEGLRLRGASVVTPHYLWFNGSMVSLSSHGPSYSEIQFFACSSARLSPHINTNAQSLR